jgi:FkbM family methyltransferase
MFDVGKALIFVQVGAFDGQSTDPLWQYIAKCGWRGILVEPQQAAANKLRRCYSESAEIEIVEAAIDRQIGERSFFIVDIPNGPAWSGGLASFDRDTILKHESLLPGIEHYIREIMIKTTTFDEILDHLPGKRLDVLQIDAEGADALLLSLFPFDRIQPAIVHWEIKHMSTEERESVLGKLKHYGYRFAPSGNDDMLAALL